MARRKGKRRSSSSSAASPRKRRMSQKRKHQIMYKMRPVMMVNRNQRRRYSHKKRYDEGLVGYVAKVYKGKSGNFGPVKKAISGCHEGNGSFIIRTSCLPVGTAMRHGLHGIHYPGGNQRYLTKLSKRKDWKSRWGKVQEAFKRGH